MPQYRFEIVGRAFGRRFTWRLVERRGKRQRVLARADGDYSTKAKVYQAIAEFKCNVADAEPVDTTLPGATPFPLPPTSFEFVDGVVPLVVEESPEEDDELSQSPPEPAHKEPERQTAEPEEPERVEQPAEPAEPAEPARQSRQRATARTSTTTRERAPRGGGGRRRKGT